MTLMEKLLADTELSIHELRDVKFAIGEDNNDPSNLRFRAPTILIELCRQQLSIRRYNRDGSVTDRRALKLEFQQNE